MPEGHSVHRNAKQLNKHLRPGKLQVVSPQGRFSEGASLITGREIKIARAHGKQLFIEFEGSLVCRVHLGLYGKWRLASFEQNPPEPVGAVRVRFQSENYFADLRGPTACEVITKPEAKKLMLKLGPDPIQPDVMGVAQQDFIQRVQRSKVSIGQQLMNQEVIAGIGNVYRAELLFRAGQSPFTPGNEVHVEVLEKIWTDAVMLMAIGVQKGIMLTRSEMLRGRPKIADRYYVYKREGLPCRLCEANISIDLMQARKLYWCAVCQT